MLVKGPSSMVRNGGCDRGVPLERVEESREVGRGSQGSVSMSLRFRSALMG